MYFLFRGEKYAWLTQFLQFIFVSNHVFYGIKYSMRRSIYLLNFIWVTNVMNSNYIFFFLWNSNLFEGGELAMNPGQVSIAHEIKDLINWNERDSIEYKCQFHFLNGLIMLQRYLLNSFIQLASDKMKSKAHISKDYSNIGWWYLRSLSFKLEMVGLV